MSYAQEIVKVQFGEEYNELIKWIENLPYFYETEDAIIVHAAFEHDKQLFNQEENVLSGTTSGERYLEKKYGQGKYWSDFYNGSKPVIYGHHVVGDTPKIKNNTYGIDTGACHGGYLTAIELPGFKVHQVKVKKDYWKQEQEEWQIPVLKSKGWNDMELTDIRKQLAKLDYIENPEVKNLLQKIDEWLEKSTEQIMRVKAAIDELAQSMLVKPDDFNLLASKYSFGRFLFMSRANKLKVEELQKVFNTPYAIKNISEELNLSFEEIRL